MKKLILICSIFFAIHANAGILLEPYLGYATGTYDGGSGNKGKESGIGYGARIGYSIPMFWFALDANQANLNNKPDSGSDFDSKATNLGVTVGVELPAIRLYAGYVVDAKNDIDDSSVLKGKGMKVGAGFKLPLLPIAFNLDYNMLKFDKADSTTIPEVKVNYLLLSVSAPFNL